MMQKKTRFQVPPGSSTPVPIEYEEDDGQPEQPTLQEYMEGAFSKDSPVGKVEPEPSEAEKQHLADLAEGYGAKPKKDYETSYSEFEAKEFDLEPHAEDNHKGKAPKRKK